MDDLYKRMGNAFLQERKRYDHQQYPRQTTQTNAPYKSTPSGIQLHRSLRSIQRSLGQTYDQFINDLDHQKLEREIERER